MTKLNYLKLKKELKLLSKKIREAKKIRREAERNYSKSNYSHNLKNITMEKSEIIFEMFKKNPYRALAYSISLVDDLKYNFRHQHIVYCLARGKTMKQIEPKVHKNNEAKIKEIDHFKKKYGFDEPREDINTFKIKNEKIESLEFAI